MKPKSLKIKYLDNLSNRNYGSLEMESKPGEFLIKNDMIQLQKTDTKTIIEKIISVSKQNLKGFRLANWLRIDYLNENKEKETTYITRRSFYHPSIKKIKLRLEEHIVA